MSIFSRAISPRRFDAAHRTGHADPRAGRSNRLLFRKPAAGVWVDEHVALTYSAVWAAVSHIAKSLMQTPWHTYRRLGDDGRERIEVPASRLLLRRANPELSASQFRRTLTAHLLLWGNGYAEIERSADGTPVALWPITPDRVTPTRIGSRLVYEVAGEGGSARVLLDSEDVFHVAGLSWDGLLGYSPIRLAAESVSAGLAAERFVNAFWGNDARPGMVLQHPGVLDEDARTNLRDSMLAMHGGAAKSWLPMVLEEGMTIVPISVPPRDAQFLESRAFQVVEIARWFCLPPHKLRELGRATWSNIESQDREVVKDAIAPHARAFEEEADHKLLGGDPDLYSRLNLTALIRGDSVSRSSFYATMARIGVYSINEIRAKEDEPPIEHGDEHYVELARTPVGEEPAMPEAPPPPEPETEEEDEENEEEASHRRPRADSTVIHSALDVLRQSVGDVAWKCQRAMSAAMMRHDADYDEWRDRFFGLKLREELLRRTVPAGCVLSAATGCDEAEMVGRLSEIADRWMVQAVAVADSRDVERWPALADAFVSEIADTLE